jgi:hypothetical protein
MKTQTAPVEPAKPFVMPLVSPGDTVVWYVDGDRHAGEQMASVLSVYGNSLDLLVQTRDMPLRKWSVHHVDDPIFKTAADVRRNGGWGLSAQAKKLRELETRLEALEDRATR